VTHNFQSKNVIKQKVKVFSTLLGHFRELQLAVSVGIEYLQLETRKENQGRLIGIKVLLPLPG
jgi:hypothetical protein